MMKLALIVLSLVTLLGIDQVRSKEVRRSIKTEAAAEKSILCDDKSPKTVRITYGRVTVLNFPFRPKDIVKVNPAFEFKQIKNDLVLTALRVGANSNVVIYLEERRCLFNLKSVMEGGDDLLIVKDPKDSQYEVRF